MANTAGAYGSQYTGSIPLLSKRAITKQLFDPNQDDEFLDFLLLSGAGDRVASSQYSTFYRSPRTSAIDTTAATVTGSGTPTVTVTSLTAANANKLIVGKQVLMPNDMTARVQSVTTTTLRNDTVVLKSVTNSNLTLVAGGKMWQFSNMQEEGSLKPDPERRDMTSILNKTQIFRYTVEETDISRAEEIEILINGQSTWANLAKIEGLQAHRIEVAQGLVHGELSAASFSDASPVLTGARGYGVQGTRGLIQTILAFGIQDTVATPGTVTAADWRDFTARLRAARVSGPIMLAGSGAAIGLATDYFKGLGSSGIAPAQLNVDGRTIDLEVEKVYVDGLEFNFKRLFVFENPDVVNPTSDVGKSLWGWPMGKARTVDGQMMNRVGYKYQPVIHPGDGTEQEAEVHTGALALRPTDGTAVEAVTYESIMGFDANEPQKMFKLKVAA